VKGIPQTSCTRFPPVRQHLTSRSAPTSSLPFLFLGRRSAPLSPHIVRGECAPYRTPRQKARRDAKDDEHTADDEFYREKIAETEVPPLHWTRFSHPRSPICPRAGLHQLRLGRIISYFATYSGFLLLLTCRIACLSDQ
jgi:hypothetical protein